MRVKFFTTRVLLFLFVASWLNVPGMVYERWSLDKLLAYHGHDYVPFFIPALLIFIFTTAEMSRLSKERMFLKFSLQDLTFLSLCILIIFLEIFHSGSIGTKVSLKLFLPIFTFYGFYFIYSRYSYLTKSSDPTNRLINYSVYLLVFILSLHIMGYLDLVPHYFEAGAGSEIAIQRLLDFKRINVVQLNSSSFYAVFLMFILLFYRKFLNFKTSILVLFFLLALLVLFWNQSRGAMSTLLLILFIKLLETERIKTFFKVSIFTVSVFSLGFLAVRFSSVRIFDLLDSSGLERITLMYYAMLQIFEHPLLGLGASFEQQNRWGVYVKLGAHSWVLRFLIGYGFVGFILILFSYLKMYNQRVNFCFLASLGLVLGVMSFEERLYWWLSILPVFSLYAYRMMHLNQSVKAT